MQTISASSRRIRTEYFTRRTFRALPIASNKEGKLSGCGKFLRKLKSVRVWPRFSALNNILYIKHIIFLFEFRFPSIHELLTKIKINEDLTGI